jgi:hypothetical protein
MVMGLRTVIGRQNSNSRSGHLKVTSFCSDDNKSCNATLLSDVPYRQQYITYKHRYSGENSWNPEFSTPVCEKTCCEGTPTIKMAVAIVGKVLICVML